MGSVDVRVEAGVYQCQLIRGQGFSKGCIKVLEGPDHPAASTETLRQANEVSRSKVDPCPVIALAIISPLMFSSNPFGPFCHAP